MLSVKHVQMGKWEHYEALLTFLNRFTQPNVGLFACDPCLSTCPAGEQLTQTCTTTVDDTCEPCPAGKFKAEAGGAQCADCLSICGPGTFLTGTCTATVQPTCEQCASDSFKPNNGPEVCTPCITSCPAGKLVCLSYSLLILCSSQVKS